MIGKTLFFCYGYAMENKTKNLMPQLPDFSKEIANSKKFLAANPEKKEDVLLLLFALLYQNQNSNSFEAYNFLFALLEKIFPRLEAYTFAKFHFALVTAPQHQEKFLSRFQSLFSASEKQKLLTELEQSPFFNSPKNKELLQRLHEDPEHTSHEKKSLPGLLSLPQKQLHSISKQLKENIPFKFTHTETLTSPLTDFQKSLQEFFEPFYPVLNRDKTLQQELENFLQTLKNQKYHIVITGEGKRGKSSLINALLKQNISLVEESIPKTAVPIEFYFSETEEYHVEFLEEKDLAKQKESYALQGLFQKKEFPASFSFGKKIKIKKQQLADYTDVDGKFVQQTAKAFIGLNNELLAQGFCLSDTPGLNCVNSFHDYLTYKESLQADCLIFIVDARKPDSASELSFLREITAKSRAINLLGVISNLDRLNKQEKSQNSIDRANLLFQEAAQHNAIKFLGLYPLNPKALMAHFCFQKSLSAGELQNWNNFLDSIVQAIQNDTNTVEYQQKISDNAEKLLRRIEQNLEKNQKEITQIYPNNFIQILEKHEQSLIAALEKYRTQATQISKSAEKDILTWQKQQEEALDLFEEKFIQTIQLKTREFADTLGSDIAKSDKWKEFDQKEAKELARTLVQDFVRKQEEQLQLWEEKIKIFHKDIHMLSNECLETISSGVHTMGDIKLESTTLNNVLIQGNLKMKQLSLFLAGAGSAFILSTSFFNLITVGSIALAFLGDPISISGLVLTGIGAITLHFQGDIQKHKKNILEKKQKKIEAWAKKIRTALEEAIQEKQDEICRQYQTIIQQSFLPSFELLFSETIHIHWYNEFLKHLNENANTEKQNNQKSLEKARHFLTS